MNNQQKRSCMMDNLNAKISYSAEKMKKMNVLETEYLLRVDAGLPSYNFNIITLSEKNINLPLNACKKEIDHYNQKGFPMNVWCWEDRAGTIDVLQRTGLREYETSYVGMLAYLEDLSAAAYDRKDFIIKEVTAAEELIKFGKVLSSLYKETGEYKQINAYFKEISSLPLKSDSKMKHYIGLYEGEIVSIGSLMFTGKTAGMYDIATLQDARGKGLGTEMVQFLINKAKDSGAVYCTLQASPEAENIYKRLGFEKIGGLKVFANFK
jgi:GNAT superfamily N-acetyltransferase